MVTGIIMAIAIISPIKSIKYCMSFSFPGRGHRFPKTGEERSPPLLGLVGVLKPVKKFKELASIYHSEGAEKR